MSPLELTPQLQHWQQQLIGLLQQQDPDADGAHDLSHFPPGMGGGTAHPAASPAG
jgi:hypothetical protein